MNKTVAIIIAVALMLCTGMGVGAWWWTQQAQGPVAPMAPVINPQQASYVTLDKVVVMLRPDSERFQNYYLSVDLVLRSDKLHEKAVKADLPMLRGVTVRSLSKLQVADARAMTIEEWTDLLSRDLMAAYESQLELRGFDQVMVSRLIIE